MKFYKLIYLIILLIFSSCLSEENQTLVPLENLSTSELILQNLEENGDYINSWQNPSLIDAKNLKENLSEFVLLDISLPEKYAEGHIKGAINIAASELLTYLENNKTSKKIVIISTSGQHASFCTSLLRLIGYSNTYSLNFGMASWNSDLIAPWTNALKSQSVSTFGSSGYVYKEKTKLPNQGTVAVSQLSSFMRTKVNSLLALPFEDEKTILVDEELTIAFETLDFEYYEYKEVFGKTRKVLKEGYYMGCYGNSTLYLLDQLNGHPPQTVLIQMFNGSISNLRSGEFLQNIPSNKTIFIYSFNGQRGAYVVAFLRLLGYKAKNIMFGAHNFHFKTLTKVTELREYVFSPDKLNDFEYETEK